MNEVKYNREYVSLRDAPMNADKQEMIEAQQR